LVSVVLFDEVAEPVVAVGAAVALVRVEEVPLDAVGAAVAALATDGIYHFGIIERLASLPLPRAARVLLRVVETRVERFAARLDEIRLAAPLPQRDFARTLVRFALDDRRIRKTVRNGVRIARHATKIWLENGRALSRWGSRCTKRDFF
jgi:hypothetical protein